jgi:hypothetical protein
MRRRLEIGLALLLVAAVVFVLVFVHPGKQPENVVVFGEKPSSSAAYAKEATLRSVIDTDLRYLLETIPPSKTSRVRVLKAGALDRIRTVVPVSVTFDNGARQLSSTIFPGKPYSVRYDDKGLIRVYPGSHGREDAADLAPYVPTPIPVVEKMLEMAGVGGDDVVYDIGCGDGRMVIAAAREYGARGVGIELDAGLIEECRTNAEREGVAKLTRFIRMDATKARFTEATVIAVYLLPESLELLRPLFERDLKPGARIVSHNYRIAGWEDTIAGQETLQDENGLDHRIFLYRR